VIIFWFRWCHECQILSFCGVVLWRYWRIVHRQIQFRNFRRLSRKGWYFSNTIVPYFLKFKWMSIPQVALRWSVSVKIRLPALVRGTAKRHKIRFPLLIAQKVHTHFACSWAQTICHQIVFIVCKKHWSALLRSPNIAANMCGWNH